jgi:methylase of polypeptide subunit release factors
VIVEFEIPGHPGFTVSHNSDEDGGGTWFGQEYVTVIQQRYQRRFGRCLEWCSGPGFIGFALLANDLCEHIVLMDSHVPVAESVRETTHRNRIEAQTTFYCGNEIAQLPGSEMFDLIVANPPHYLECPGDANYQRIAVDQDWRAHREFYNHIGQHMHPDCVILIQENQAGSLQGPAEWQDMIQRAGLQITAYFTSAAHYDTRGPTQIYYMEVRQK